MTTPSSPLLSRRSFLKTLGVSAAVTAMPSVAAAATDSTSSSQELATVLDLEKCIACGACVDACHEANAAKFPEPQKPFPTMYPPRVKVSDWSDKRDVNDRLTPYNWLFIQSAQVEHEGQSYDINVPRRCLHCTNPPCANLCPFGAARKQENGVVRIETDLCLGGAKCKTVCPWDIPQRQTGVGLYLRLLPSFAGNGVMYKCDRCYDRLTKGEKPACIEVCPQEVQTIGPRDEMLALAQRMAKEKNGYLYGVEENGGTNTFYVSPVPFEKLNAAIDKGPGKPSLSVVPNSMENEENIGYAVMVAPVAGMVAGLWKVKSFLSNQGGKENHHD